MTRRYFDDVKEQDYRAALICWLTAEINRNPKKRPKPFKVEDFMPKRDRTKPLTDEQMKKQLELINIALRGKKSDGK